MTLSTPRYVGKHVTLKGAAKHVKRGLAVWANAERTAIQFRMEDRRVQSAAENLRQRELTAICGYDRAAQAGIASRKQLRGLPTLGDTSRLLTLLTTWGSGDKRGVYRDGMGSKKPSGQTATPAA